MPTRVTFAVEAPDGIQATNLPERLHALASWLFDEHPARRWSIGPLCWFGGEVQWSVVWLDDDHLPDRLLRLTEGRLGRQRVRLAPVDVGHRSYRSLLEHGDAVAADVHVVSPTWFSRSGIDYPLPDPRVVFDSLRRRWNTLAPDDVIVDDDRAWSTIRRLAVAAVSLDSLRIERFVGVDVEAESPLQTAPRLGPPTGRARGVGFVGDVRFVLVGDAAHDTDHRRLFTALASFAGLAGIGAQTTHGFGACDVVLSGPRPGPAAS